jgi:imidazolonepropionase-like amidohydrolase
VEEARAVGTYVTAHAYSGAAIDNAMQAGVRCIEHGNLMHEGAARAMKSADAFLVPTMVASLVIERDGARYGVSAETMRKIRIVRARAVESLDLAYRTGLRIGSGSDLIGPMNADQALELELKARVLSPLEVLVSATRTNAELFGLEAEIGTVEPGKWADLLVVRGDPLRDLRLLQSPAENLLLIMKAGTVVKSLL